MILQRGTSFYSCGFVSDDTFASYVCSRCEKAFGFNIPIVLGEGDGDQRSRFRGEAAISLALARVYLRAGDGCGAGQRPRCGAAVPNVGGVLRPLFTTLLQIEREVYGSPDPSRGTAQADQSGANADAPTGSAAPQPSPKEGRCAFPDCDLPRFHAFHVCGVPGHAPLLACHLFIDPRSVAPSFPSSPSPSPTGTPERDGSGVPPAGENDAEPTSHTRLRAALDQLRPILPGSPYLVDEAIAQLERIPSLEAQVTSLQAQRDMAANRRREFVASVEELIERWARS